EDGEGWRRDRPTQARAIIDFVDDNSSQFDPDDGFNRIREDYGYESLREKYKPKNNYFDTVGEIRLVRGVDDRFWTLFGSSLTVYGGCKLNLSAISDVKLIATLIANSAKNPDDPLLRDPTGRQLWTLSRLVQQAIELGFPFSTADEFVQFVGNPQEGFMLFMSALSANTDGAGPSAEEFLPGTPIEGIELDPAKLNAIATTGPRRTYRIEATASIDIPGTDSTLNKRIVGIWDKEVIRQKTRLHGNQQATAQDKGYWVFWRED
ncbi:MAG: hypothetical protein AAGC55_29295, partial [Myxococcota bacterium]